MTYETIYGDIEFGEFFKSDPNDTHNIALVHKIVGIGQAKSAMDGEEKMMAMGADSFVMPEKYRGEVFYSQAVVDQLREQSTRCNHTAELFE